MSRRRTQAAGAGRCTSFVIIREPTARYAAADAEFLETDCEHRVQLRPVLLSELTPGRVHPPGVRMLVYRSDTGDEMRALVEMPPHQRANTRSNVVRAIRHVARFEPIGGDAFRRALDGVDSPFFSAVAESARARGLEMPIPSSGVKR